LTTPDDETPAEADVRKRTLVPKVVFAVCLTVLVLIAAGLATLRYGVLLPQARLLIEVRADGLKVGRFGRLRIEGLSGDVWHDLSVRRLTIRDEKGIWLDARNVHLVWSYAELLQRRFHAEQIAIQQVQVLRRPTLTPKGEDHGMPVSFHIDDLHGRLEMLPAFSYRRGVYDLKAKLDVERSDRQSGRLAAASVLHPGDRLDVSFDLGKARPILVDAKADEARGGALAGALGLPADQAFNLRLHAEGTTSNGRFTALAVSGTHTPLKAAGDWTPQGGAAGGRLDLTASRLTEGLARRLGPQVRFAIGGRRANARFSYLDLRASAANLALTAKGLGDLGKRRTGPQGLAVTLATPDLSKVAGGPAKGPARVQGTWTGDAGRWRFAGTAQASKASLAGYSLERAAGPLSVEFKDKAFTVTADLAGQGGAGRGWAAAMLGARPRARLSGSRLADGRMLLRELDVTGAGLKVEAAGDRGLLGGLNFHGKGEIFNIAAAHKGAAGAVAGSWSASQAGRGKPWNFTVDAKGAGFASGLSELDRLLGPEPRLSGKASLAGGKVSVAEAVLTGAQAQLQTAGLVGGPGGALNLKLDWTANGPFRAGPVEISGKAKGSGALTGTLGAPRADLLADFAEIDVPRAPLKNAHVTLSFVRQADGSSGMVTLLADSAYGQASAKSAFRFPEGGVDLTDLAVNAAGVKARGSLALRRSAPSAADLTVALGRGAVLDGGRISGAVKIVDAPGGARASLDLTAANAVLPRAMATIRSGRVTASGPLARLPYETHMSGQLPSGPWSLDGQGTLAIEQASYALTFSGDGKAGGRALRTVEPTLLRISGKAKSARFRLAAADGGRIDIDAALSDGAADIRARATALGLSVLNEDLAGQANLTLALQGRGGALGGTLDARLQSARARGSPAAIGLDGTLKARISGDSLILDAAVANGQGLKANANLVLPAETSASPFRIAIARTRPMHGTFFADGEVKPLWDLLVGGERTLSGHVHTEGSLGGSIADPTAVGTASVQGGQFNDGSTGLALRDVVLKASFAHAAIDVTQATGSDGHGGTLGGSGRISLARNGVSSFRLDLKGFRLIDNEQATASATGSATIDRDAAGKVRLSGALTIDRADVAANPPAPTGVVTIDVIEKNRPADLDHALGPARKLDAGWALDVTLKAPRRIFLRGRGLDLELSLDAHVGGTTGHPNLTGVARVVRGDYDFAGKRFTFDNRGVVYLSTRPEEIRLDLSATRDDPALTATVQIRGTAAKPEIALTSTPVLPNDEVLSQVLFGRSASQLSTLEAAQLASALSALSGNGGFDVVGNLRTFARLDRLALGGDEASGVTVSGGKYLTETVYLEITGGGREGPSAQVEWRVGHGLSLLSRLAGQRDAKLAVRWRRDY
jgi:translocation and assembly module TamB